MSARRTPSPSPSRSRIYPTSATQAAELGQARVRSGEGGRERSERPGEGAFDKNPSPASLASARSAPSPARGEGTERVARAVDKATLNAKALRSRMTDAERKLWFALRDRRFSDFKFRRQAPIGPFIADFICYGARVVIEVDGGQHVESSRDARRDGWFAANDFHVLRFWNNDVLSNLEGVLTALLDLLHKRTPHPARAARGRPSPARGEGFERAARGVHNERTKR